MDGKQTNRKFVLVVQLVVVLALLDLVLKKYGHLLELICQYEKLPKRIGNRKRKLARSTFMHTFMHEFDDEQIKNHTGLSRRMFNYVLQLIQPDIQVDTKQAQCSTGSHLTSLARLFIHQRLLKGAKYIDTEWIGTDPRHVWENCWKPVAEAIDKKLDNVNFDYKNEDALRLQADHWDYIQMKKYGSGGLTRGLLLAGDGLIIKIKKPTKQQLCEVEVDLDKF